MRIADEADEDIYHTRAGARPMTSDRGSFSKQGGATPMQLRTVNLSLEKLDAFAMACASRA